MTEELKQKADQKMLGMTLADLARAKRISPFFHLRDPVDEDYERLLERQNGPGWSAVPIDKRT